MPFTSRDIFEKTKGNRDPIFEDVLSYLNNNPANILEIGCLRECSISSRIGDGWSSYHFANYIDQYGGSLICCDTSESSINNCQKALSGLNINKRFINKSGTDFLKENPFFSFDLVFLDGSDSAEEMYEQYELTKGRASFIFCDDFHKKGRILKEKNIPAIVYKWPKNNHELALLYNGVTPSVKMMVEVE